MYKFYLWKHIEQKGGCQRKAAPQSPNDFRPISLINFSVKILCKVLANRLQAVMAKPVDQNQYGFIKGMSIQDC